MVRFLMGALVALGLLAGPAHASLVPGPTFSPPTTNPNEADLVALVQGLFPGKTVTWLGKSNTEGNPAGVPEAGGQGTLSVTYSNAKNSAGTWTYTPTAPNTLLPNVIAIFGGAKGGVYLPTAGHFAGLSTGEWDFGDFGITAGMSGNAPALSNISALHVTPLPAAVWMMGAGLAGLAGWRRFRRA